MVMDNVIIYTDFEKAFDKIEQCLFLQKLCNTDFTNSLLKLLISYLTGSSKPFSQSSGVPQGSNLRPLSFLLFINDQDVLLLCIRLHNFFNFLVIFCRSLFLVYLVCVMTLLPVFLEWKILLLC